MRVFIYQGRSHTCVTADNTVTNEEAGQSPSRGSELTLPSSQDLWGSDSAWRLEPRLLPNHTSTRPTVQPG